MTIDLKKMFDQASEDEQVEFLAEMMSQDLLTKDQAIDVLKSRKSVDSLAKLSASQKIKAEVKNLFQGFVRIIITSLLFILKAFLWLVKIPFFLLSFIKNWFFMGLGLWLTCWFLKGVYHVVVLEQYTPFQAARTSMDDSVTIIIISLAGVLALVGTALEFNGKID